MKTRPLHFLIACLLCVLSPLKLQAQTTAFTYQGQLTQSGSPANGLYDLDFELFDDAIAGSSLGALGTTATAVSNGLFTVVLDFGSSVFDGTDLWLQISSTTNGGVLVPLSPRQPITSTPYAIKAASAMTVDMGTLSNPIFLGTTSTAPLELYVNNEGGFRLEYPSSGTVPNLIGGYSGNTIGSGTEGAVIAGGGGNSVLTSHFIGANSGHSAIAGGYDNTILGNTHFSSIAGGRYNVIWESATASSISGGQNNDIGKDANFSSIGGGASNTIGSNSYNTVIAGGVINEVGMSSWSSTIGGGYNNSIGNKSLFSTIGGGHSQVIGLKADYTVIGGGRANTIASNSLSATISGGQYNSLQVNTDSSTISGGSDNTVADNANNVTIAGGALNDVGENSSFATISGGNDNDIATASGSTTIAGGRANDIGTSSGDATIGGGYNNNILDQASSSTIAGGNGNQIGYASFYNFVGGGTFNTINSNTTSATIMGGYANTIVDNGDYGSIGGGNGNSIGKNAKYAVIPGGDSNVIEEDASYAFAAGRNATAAHAGSFVWADNQFSTFSSTAADQFLIRASGGVGIGKNNPTTALDVSGTVKASSFIGSGSSLTGLPNGHALDAADGSPANRLYVDNGGNVGIGTTTPEGDLHVRGLSTLGEVIITPSSANSQSQILLTENTTASIGMIFRYAGDEANNPLHIIPRISDVDGTPVMTIERSGNVGIGDSDPSQALDVVGNIVATGTITGSSDRNRKENFATVDPATALEKVTAMPIQRWNYIDEQVTHIGPMAQDFYGAFQVGMDDKHISMVDADGVALAAIQGLNLKLEQENAELRQRLERLEKLFEQELSRGEQ